LTTVKELAAGATGPLKGVRILDLTSVLNGPYATQILADQGAEVIKVEEPGGDIGRWGGDVPDGAPRDMGPLFLNINRNKRSIVLDLKQGDDRRSLLALIGRCDVFVTSVRYGALERLGLGYDEVRKSKPDIIYAHAAGYGSEGPYAGEPAYDDLIQSACGLADLPPRTDGTSAPRLLPTVLADKVCSLFMAQAITAALLHRATTGEGQFVEVPMLECMTSFVMVEHLYDHAYEPPTGPYGYPRVLNRNRKPFATKDGYIGLLPYTDKQWDVFFEAAEVGDAVKNDPRFATYASRGKHIEELYGLVEQVVAGKTTAEWIALLKPLSIPVVKTNRLEDVEHDPHIRAVELFETYAHPELGTYRQIRPAVKFSRTPSNIRRHPPRLGEHAREILAEISGQDE
jgi:crotonobetainyl-CoA:carnitine CoA-transferase CaiB-like acyl-CoA transferase